MTTINADGTITLTETTMKYFDLKAGEKVVITNENGKMTVGKRQVKLTLFYEKMLTKKNGG